MCARGIVTRPKMPEASTSERRDQEKANAARPVRYAMDCATGKSRGQEKKQKKTEGNTWSLAGWRKSLLGYRVAIASFWFGKDLKDSHKSHLSPRHF